MLILASDNSNLKYLILREESLLYKSNKHINKSLVFFIVRITTNCVLFIFIASEQEKQLSKTNLLFAFKIKDLCCLFGFFSNKSYK